MAKPTCEYCGRCLSVCPSYKHFLVETMSPRARVDLIKGVADGSLRPTARYAESLAGCLQCLACTDICGKGVDGAQTVLEARLAQGMGKQTFARRLEHWVTSFLLPRRTLLTWLVRAGAWLQWALPAECRGTVRHLPDALSGLAGQRSLPVLAKKSLFALLPEVIPASADVPARGPVALFSGCFGGVVSVGASLRLVRALSARGYTVHVPRAQSCCGAPALLSGFGDAFAASQRQNAAVFAALPNMPVLTLCATCHRTLSREYTDAGQPLAARIVDAALFLRRHDAAQAGSALSVPEMRALPETVRRIRADRPVSVADPLLVTVHDPCHLRLDPQVGQALRAAVAARPWLKLVELPTPGLCCGGGGISSLKNPEVAEELGEARARAVLATGADVVIAECPGCVLQLNNHLSRLHSAVRACHPLELLG